MDVTLNLGVQFLLGDALNAGGQQHTHDPAAVQCRNGQQIHNPQVDGNKRAQREYIPKSNGHTLRLRPHIGNVLDNAHRAGDLFQSHLTIQMPETTQPIGARKEGAATVLLCGTDQEGTRTDTMMLLYLNAQEQAVTLVSLPRDTLTHTASGNDAKLNSAYGRNNGGEEGMEALLDYVADIIGYRPDGYMLITLDAFVDIVDLMGGVEFDVPMDMFYEDSSQDLFIDLKEGKQTLDGYAAMGLVRFRKGYYDQDLGRVDVQRQFLSACMDQWLTLPNLVKLPQILSTMHASSESSLTTGNLLWIAYTAWRSGLGNLQTETLPGYADMLDGVSYYILDPEGVADVINRCCNPYTREIDASDLNIVY